MERARLLQAVGLLSKHAGVDDESLAAELAKAGFSMLEANLLIVLVPTAFSRPLLEKAGITDLLLRFLLRRVTAAGWTSR